MNKQNAIVSIIKSFIIGIFILCSSIILAKSVAGNSNLNEGMYFIGRQLDDLNDLNGYQVRVTETDKQRYQIISHGEEIIIFDTVTGEYYSKVDSGSNDSSNWTKTENPFYNELE